jgi:hypothetical protein
MGLAVAAAVVGAQTGPRASSSPAGQKAAEAPIPVRNDRAKPGRELLVLRQHELRKGGHEEFYRLSAQNVWPFMERNGVRIVGQWKITESSEALPPDLDHVYRLVRYASFEHWQASRSTLSNGASAADGGGGDIRLGGNGPAQALTQAGYTDRGALEVGSKGAYFLEGVDAPGGPYFMPGLGESYDLIESGVRPAPTGGPIPVRVDVAQPGDEIVEVRYQRIAKGSFERFVEATRSAVWPWEEKLGARPMGQWLVAHPAAPSRTAENGGYDEVITMTRYASRAHRLAMQEDEAVFMGGNGPDYGAWRAALRLQRDLTRLTSIDLAQGFFYESPPKFLPGLKERYQPKK